jgi:hypothetical protein
MDTTDPHGPDLWSAPSEMDVVHGGAGANWLLAISLVVAWRGNGSVRPQAAVAQRLAEMVAEGGAAVVEQAALGLTDVAGMLLELYADHVGASSDDVLQDVATLMSDKSAWG